MKPLDPKTEVTTSTILMRAAEIIRQRGHTKGTLWDRQGRVCLHGAICIAKDENSVVRHDCRAERQLAFYLLTTKGVKPDNPGSDYFSNCNWNNMEERTKEEVIAALEDAATWKPREQVAA